MRKFILCVVLSTTIFIAQAQTEQGDWMVGGGFRLNTSDNNTLISLNPDAGAFVIRRLAIGGNVDLTYSKVGDIRDTYFGIGPFVRYYFSKANVKPIVHGKFNFVTEKTKIPSGSNSNTGINYFLGAGAAIFISEQVSIDALMGYDHTKIKDFDGSGGFAMTIGFQVYLLKHQVDRVRGRQ